MDGPAEDRPWHENDEFWEAAAAGLFDRECREAAVPEVDGVIRLAGIVPGTPVLDLCCGVGRHSLELARRGFAVTGVDRTAFYLDEAGEQASREGLELELVQADMRDFRRDGAFGAVINLYTSFGYFDDPGDDRRVLENVRASLRPGGRLVLQTMGKEVLARNFRERDWREAEGCLILQETRILRDWNWAQNRWVVISDGAAREFLVEHRLYSAAELERLLVECGFSSIEAFGDLAGSPYDHRADRLVIVAR